ncbi:hypothetical protein AAVH_19314 [Aphelenchoides avenae]|nr:hypothetical protein AAVH_19314 [Aphelenchus avenae]
MTGAPVEGDNAKHSNDAYHAFDTSDANHCDNASDVHHSNNADKTHDANNADKQTYNNKPGSSSSAPRPTIGGKPVTAAMRKLYEANQAKDAAERRREADAAELARFREYKRKEYEREQQQREDGEVINSDDGDDLLRTKRPRLELFANDGFASASARGQRQRQHQFDKYENKTKTITYMRVTAICYNEAQLRKEKEKLAKERAAIDWNALSCNARKRKAKKKDDDVFVVEAIVALKYCRVATCDYCLDYGRWMRLWYIKWEGYAPEHNSWEHAGNLDHCVELLTDAIFSAGAADPESEEQCLDFFNGPEQDVQEGEAPLQIALRDEVFPEPKRYEWMRFGGAVPPLPLAADPDDADDNRGTIYSGREPDQPFVCKDGTVLEPVVVTARVWADLNASFRRHKTKAATVKEFMRLHRWAQKIQQDNKGLLRGKESDVRRQLEALHLFDEPAGEVAAEGGEVE